MSVRQSQKVKLGKDYKRFWQRSHSPSLTLPTLHVAGVLGVLEAFSSHFLVPFSPSTFRDSLTLTCPPCFTGQHRTSHCRCQPGILSLTALLLPSRLGVPCPCCSLHHPLDYLLPNIHWSQTKGTTQLTYLSHSNISFLIRLTRVIITVSPSQG